MITTWTDRTQPVSQVKEALVEQEEDIELEIALSALERRHRSGRKRCTKDAAGLQRITAVAGRAAGETVIESTRCAAKMSLASQTLTASGESDSCRSVAVATCNGLRHRSRHVALPDSGNGKLCTGVAYEVQNCGSSRACEEEAKVGCQWTEWNCGQNGTHGLHAA